jgi:hypothetical protein
MYPNQFVHANFLVRCTNEAYRSTKETDAILEVSITVLPKFFSAGLINFCFTTGQANPVLGLVTAV